MGQSQPQGVQVLLAKLAATSGTITAHNGVLVFPDKIVVDLKADPGPGMSSCWHCGALMNEAQRYLCGCPKCREEA